MTIIKPLDHRTVEKVWQDMSQNIPLKAGGKHHTISGISTVHFDMRHVGVLYKREFYRALTKGYLDSIFGCNLGEDQGEREYRVRLLGKRFWDFALCRGGFTGSNKNDGWIQLADKSWKRPCDFLRSCLPDYSLSGQILKLGFHRACVHPTFQRIREEWVSTYGPAYQDETSSSYDSSDSCDSCDSSDDEVLKIVSTKHVVTKVQTTINSKKRTLAESLEPPTKKPSVPVVDRAQAFEDIVSSLHHFKHTIRSRNRVDNSLFAEGTVFGPVVRGYKLFVKKRKVGENALDFYIAPPQGSTLRSVVDLKRHVGLL